MRATRRGDIISLMGGKPDLLVISFIGDMLPPVYTENLPLTLANAQDSNARHYIWNRQICSLVQYG